MYDPTIGRWLSTDPYDQFASPYLGMGNDPVNNVGPDGGAIWAENPAPAMPHLTAFSGSLGGSATPAVGQLTTAQGVSVTADTSGAASSSSNSSGGGGALHTLGN